jgi:transketolase
MIDQVILDQTYINSFRFFAVVAVQKAKSRQAGMPVGAPKTLQKEGVNRLVENKKKKK